MLLPIQVYAFFAFVFVPYTVLEVDALNYASFDSGDENFKLQWAYNNSKLFFNMTCKTTGWCAVGFTTTDHGKNMVNYDIAVAGVASNTSYINDYWSTSKETPSNDSTQNFNLLKASEADGHTNVEFERDATTGDHNNDVQFKENTTVFIVWALRNNDDANSGLNSTLKHNHKGVSSEKRNLINEAKSPAIQPSATMVQPSATMVQPSTTMVQPSTTMVQPSTTMVQPSTTMVQPSTTMVQPSTTMVQPSTTNMQSSTSGPTSTSKNARSDAASPVVTYAILILSVCALHF